MDVPLRGGQSGNCIRSIVGAPRLVTATERIVAEVLPTARIGQLRMPSYGDLVAIVGALTRRVRKDAG